MLVEAGAAHEAIDRSRSGPQGLIRVSCPPALVCLSIGTLIAHKPCLVTDDMSQLLYAATEGVGVVQLPGIVADEALRLGGLVNLLPDWTPAAGVAQAIFALAAGSCHRDAA